MLLFVNSQLLDEKQHSLATAFPPFTEKCRSAVSFPAPFFTFIPKTDARSQLPKQRTEQFVLPVSGSFYFFGFRITIN